MDRLTPEARSYPGYLAPVVRDEGSDPDVEYLDWTGDPRWQDLSEDSFLWTALLTWCYGLDGTVPDGLFGALHGLRCLGARLDTGPRGVRLSAGHIPREEYAALRRKYLVKHSELLTVLLAAVAGEAPLLSATA